MEEEFVVTVTCGGCLSAQKFTGQKRCVNCDRPLAVIAYIAGNLPVKKEPVKEMYLLGC